MSNRIIVPAKYTVEISILFDPHTGQTELKLKSGGPINLLILAGILSEHVTGLLKQALKEFRPKAIEGSNGDAVT